jgi:hypothetical protein
VLTAERALLLNADSSPELPKVPELAPLYQLGATARVGEMVMIAGPSGSQKSGLALFWLARMNLPTLYLSADMSGWQASVRLACMELGVEASVIEQMMKDSEGRAIVRAALANSNIQFRLGSPITWRGVEAELEAFVELHNAYPSVICWDNLMDVEGCETDYVAQSEAMQDIHALKTEIGATQFVLHHASDKPRDAGLDPYNPAPRKQIKNGLSEKPERVFTVAYNPHDSRMRIAPVKQRDALSDQTGQTFATLHAEPRFTRFSPVH